MTVSNMPNAVPPHQRYIAAVAGALHKAGITYSDWWADLNDPLDACIQLDRPGFARGVLALAWTEEAGWYYGPEDPHGEMKLVEYMGHSVLPSPAQVVAWVRQAVLSDERGLRDRPFFRSFEDDPEGFAEQLREAAAPE